MKTIPTRTSFSTVRSPETNQNDEAPEGLSTACSPFSDRSEDLFASSELVALPFSDVSNIPMFRIPVWLAIDRLYQAALLAEDCESSRSEFSVAYSQLLNMGLRPEELLWLMKKGILRHLHLDQSGLAGMSQNKTIESSFSTDSRFFISDLGVELVEQCFTMAQLERPAAVPFESKSDSMLRSLKPAWDNERHELRFAGKVIKKFKWRAANQEAILAAFEEEGWPAHIDDPLPQQSNIDPKRRLADAIKSLNRHQRMSLVRFCGDGTGEGVLWEFKQ